MNRLEDILIYNKKFVEDKQYEEYSTRKNPMKKLVILSCMDTRLTELLPKAMNIKNGDAKIIKNAGATIMHPFGSIVRSILVAIYEFNAEDVIVVGHHGCGMSNLDSNSIIKKMTDRGIEEKTISILNNSGIDIDSWLQGFESVEKAIIESVNAIKDHPLTPEDVNVHGLIMDPDTGAIEVVVNGYRK
ncbi:beta-class carbonic anhydrase [Clostridiisalibacter paucivorans]|uniref:beta-class carbonic anhydrase n=1 Tax=Clostridiisalibacter paucivorans TaxID=408753 RepID=UPI00047D4181|nr:carbonic anhydrase [Clostridiisalibacter paucivorans]